MKLSVLVANRKQLNLTAEVAVDIVDLGRVCVDECICLFRILNDGSIRKVS